MEEEGAAISLMTEFSMTESGELDVCRGKCKSDFSQAVLLMLLDKGLLRFHSNIKDTTNEHTLAKSGCEPAPTLCFFSVVQLAKVCFKLRPKVAEL